MQCEESSAPGTEALHYALDAASFQSITGEALPEPTIMILEYEMHPRIKKAARNALLETQVDPPIPHGMTMARPILRKGPRPPVVPGQGPQHGVPLQDEGHQHQQQQQSFNLEAILVTLVCDATADRVLKLEDQMCFFSNTLVGKCDATAERILKLEDQMCLFFNFLKKDYEKAMRTNDMIKNDICSSKGGDNHMGEGEVLSLKGNSNSPISVTKMLEEHVAGLSNLFLSLKMANDNYEDPTGAYTTSTEDYVSAPSSNPHSIEMLGRHRASKSTMKNKGLSYKVVMDKDSTSLEENLKLINNSVKLFKEHLLVLKTGEKIEEVTAVEEQMASFCSNALFLKNMILSLTENSGDMADKVLLDLKKRDGKAMRTDYMGEEQLRSLKGNSDSLVDVRNKLEEHVADLSKSFLSLKMANVNDEETTRVYTSAGYESGSSSSPDLISGKERVAILDKRKASTSRLKYKGVASKVVMAKDMLHKELQIINEGVNFLKELLQAGKPREKEEKEMVVEVL